jgi:hypothetical protein
MLFIATSRILPVLCGRGGWHTRQIRDKLRINTLTSLVGRIAASIHAHFLLHLDDERLKPLTRSHITKPISILERLLLHVQHLPAAATAAVSAAVAPPDATPVIVAAEWMDVFNVNLALRFVRARALLEKKTRYVFRRPSCRQLFTADNA